jgi:hypothetical protein
MKGVFFVHLILICGFFMQIAYIVLNLTNSKKLLKLYYISKDWKAGFYVIVFLFLDINVN